jgi:cytochrome c5
MKRIVPTSIFGLFLLGACVNQEHSGRVESDEPKIAGSQEIKLAEGRKVYESNCSGCHDGSVGGAPRPGDKSGWAALIKEGRDVLFVKAVQGFEGKKGSMPPRGGNPELSDDEIKNAINYMTLNIDTASSGSGSDAGTPLEGSSIYCRERFEREADGAQKPECTQST